MRYKSNRNTCDAGRPPHGWIGQVVTDVQVQGVPLHGDDIRAREHSSLDRSAIEAIGGNDGVRDLPATSSVSVPGLLIFSLPESGRRHRQQVPGQR